MISKKSDDAVSPVIGVMLLLVVTVVIAAAVTIFATGVVGETEAAPVAALDVKIYDYYQALDDAGGPDFHITHLSGEPVDTRDIELRFSWTDSCGESHYSTYSADGMKEEHQNGIESPNGNGNRKQALYVKTPVTDDMRKDYDSGRLDYYFGDAILTPGMKLTATADFLKKGEENTESPFMEMIFNNYDDSIEEKGEETITFGNLRKYQSHNKKCAICNSINPDVKNMKATAFKTWLSEYNPNCPNKIEADKKTCLTCKTHSVDDCKPENYEKLKCACAEVSIIPGTEYTTGIMTHLPAGTAVDVMIVHTPSGKAIYDKTVIVQ